MSGAGAGDARARWRQLAAVAAVATVGAFVGVRVAGAVTPGTRGGATRTTLAVAGTLVGVAGPTARATFVFRNASGVRCTPPEVTVRLEAGGGFREEIDLTDCSAALFDGGDVSVDVQVNGANVITGQPIAPVPYARYAEQYGTPDCPVGYERQAAAGAVNLCARGNDQVVRVGSGASAFWIDRYEATIWTNATGTSGSRGRPDIAWGTESRDYPEGFPDNGQWHNPPRGISQKLYAVSRAGVIPSRAPTWFQAQEACRASGKRLPTGDEWLTAAQGTDDPGSHNGDGGRCRTLASTLRETGAGVACVSAWGAQDMIGNLAEWTDEWYAAPSVASTGPSRDTGWPPADMHRDRVWNVDSRAMTGYPTSGFVQGVPAATQRGGDYGSLENAGVFAMLLNFAPSTADHATGFRCVIPR